jgi:hypothetical protein
MIRWSRKLRRPGRNTRSTNVGPTTTLPACSSIPFLSKNLLFLDMLYKRFWSLPAAETPLWNCFTITDTRCHTRSAKLLESRLVVCVLRSGLTGSGGVCSLGCALALRAKAGPTENSLSCQSRGKKRNSFLASLARGVSTGYSCVACPPCFSVTTCCCLGHSRLSAAPAHSPPSQQCAAPPCAADQHQQR